MTMTTMPSDMPASTRGKWISTGNTEIDKKMGGGIPVSSLILIGGESDSGKSVLTQQLTWGSLRERFKISVLTTENTVRSFLSQMKSLNLDIEDRLLLGHLRVFPIKATRAQNGADGALRALLQAVTTEAQSRDMVIIDSVTSFIARTSPEETVAFFEDCKVLCNQGLTLIVVAHPHAFNESTLVRISSMSDTNLYLHNENLGEKLMKVLEVRKVRGAEKSTGNIVSFDVEPGWGMRIIPFTKARA